MKVMMGCSAKWKMEDGVKHKDFKKQAQRCSTIFSFFNLSRNLLILLSC